MFEKCKLRDVTDLRAGIGFPNKYQGKLIGDIPFYKVGDISREFQKWNFYLNEADNYIDNDELQLLKGKLFEKDTIVFAKVGEALKLNRRGILTKPSLIDNNVFGIRSKSDKLLNKYLFYWSLTLNLGEICRSGAVPSINQSDMYSLSIPLPKSIQEQEEIVRVLDAASDMVRLRKECIQHAQDLIPALFQEMFGDIDNNKMKYPILSIKSLCEINPSKPQLSDELMVTFLGMKDVTENGQIDLSTNKTYEEVKKGFTNFQDNDVLLAKITPCFENGKAAVVNNLTNGYGFGSTEFYVLRPDLEKILPEYLYSIIKTHRFNYIGRLNMKGAAGQKRLVKEYVLNYKFPIAPIEQQQIFAQKVIVIENYIKEQQEELKKTEDLFQSLLHHAFTGELTRHKYGEQI